ncbi:Centromere/kinetochore protein zw10, partial [Echria macrotheca]
GQVAQALVDFAVNGSFPDESTSTLPIDSNGLPSAIEALAAAKAKLQAEVHAINEETAGDVRSWRANAQSVQDDIIRSKELANDILKKSHTPIVSGKTIEEAEARAAFLARELNYNRQVREALSGIKTVNKTLDLVEQARDERRILDALHLLEKAWKEIDNIPVNKSCRTLRLLDVRAFELKSDVHQVFDHVWDSLIHVDVENQRVSIGKPGEDEPMSLEDAVIGLKAYREVDKRTRRLWDDINKAIILPRMDIGQDQLPAVRVNGGVLEIQGTSDKKVQSLLADLEKVLTFLVLQLPPDLVETISSSLLPEMIHNITKVWLDSAVPLSIRDMDAFEDVIARAKDFYTVVKALGFSNLGELHEWTESAPRVWLSKCREAALESIRSKLSRGIGQPRQVERVEKQLVSKSQGEQLAANGAITDADDQGWAAWGEDDANDDAEQATAGGDDDGTDAWGWGEEVDQPQDMEENKPSEADEEDPSIAWGWTDKASKEVSAEEPKDIGSAPAVGQESREVTIKETYHISSMPQPVLDLIQALAEDGASLTGDASASSPVAAAAAGLFGLPTHILAMFRAISPTYYTADIGGIMYLYNDATYLAEQLAEFVAEWKRRDDITAKARNMLRLDGDIKSLQNFANRAYSNELNVQKTVLNDLLGGDQSLMQQDDIENCISLAVARVRAMAIAWETILSRSTWQQAVGSLVDAVASKIISDVMELTSIGQEEAYNIANYISLVTALDDLFLPSRFLSPGQRQKASADEVPTTAQYAASWLRLQFLSEVLQSNLKDLLWLWLEADLSLYFTVDEVLDLINMSFEDNPRTREVVREITQNPRPRGY